MEVITKSAQETQKLGEKVGCDLKRGFSQTGGRIIALYGELGSGKTTFVQGLARGLEIKRRIISPTFVFVRQYSIIAHQSSTIIFYHIDLYRIKKTEETQGLGLEEILADKKAFVAIEWAEKIKNILPKKRIDIYFKYLNRRKRKIVIVAA